MDLVGQPLRSRVAEAPFLFAAVLVYEFVWGDVEWFLLALPVAFFVASVAFDAAWYRLSGG